MREGTSPSPGWPSLPALWIGDGFDCVADSDSQHPEEGFPHVNFDPQSDMMSSERPERWKTWRNRVSASSRAGGRAGKGTKHQDLEKSVCHHQNHSVTLNSTKTWVQGLCRVDSGISWRWIKQQKVWGRTKNIHRGGGSGVGRRGRKGGGVGWGQSMNKSVWVL